MRARSAAASAVASTNGLIDQANADLAKAFHIADRLATGDCADQGPGDAPEPLAHVR